MKVQVKLSNDPEIHSNAVMPWDDKSTIAYKQKHQFTTSVLSTLYVQVNGTKDLQIPAYAATDFDGATIPFGIGKGNMKLLVGALFHDIICNDKSLVNYDRHLASVILRETLIACHLSKFAAWSMFFWVELYQLFKPWHP